MNWKKSIAWYKTCVVRTNGYINIYNAVGITLIVFDRYEVSYKYLPLGIVIILAAVLIVGSLDILLGIYEAENRLGHENSPILMEILKEVKK